MIAFLSCNRCILFSDDSDLCSPARLQASDVRGSHLLVLGAVLHDRPLAIYTPLGILLLHLCLLTRLQAHADVSLVRPQRQNLNGASKRSQSLSEARVRLPCSVRCELAVVQIALEDDQVALGGELLVQFGRVRSHVGVRHGLSPETVRRARVGAKRVSMGTDSLKRPSSMCFIHLLTIACTGVCDEGVSSLTVVERPRP